MEDAFDRLRLIRSANVGPVGFVQLLARFGSAGAAIAALPDLARRGGGRAPRLAEPRAVEAELRRVEALGASLLFLGSPDYPALLAQIDNPPPVLSYRGRRDLMEARVVAMVGARNASASACRFARGLAAELGREGFAVVSGLARGIDTAAHAGSIEDGTIGIVAGGIDIHYPPENRDLQEAIAARGLLIAEQPPGTEPRARHFPFRNRIIAGLALGTVVVEAAPRSGSLITARLAGEAGREVMAIPGSPLDPRSRGCNQLIRDGAILVQSAADIAEQLGPIDARAVRAPSQPFAPQPIDAEDGARQRVQDLLSHDFVSVDELVRQSGEPPGAVQTVLLELELAGRLERGAGGRARRG
ncbi:DNA-processing protein DprA [Novosphingopyxis iocasae]|uniref:DNA-processing protein DprA n=1 Tax=Novosphingopyxis iocasae TaxID=2762729 RepID=UPI0016511055|nr:DNA-processing protein DprA [Novosphingopyxis iocasae]